MVTPHSDASPARKGLLLIIIGFSNYLLRVWTAMGSNTTCSKYIWYVIKLPSCIHKMVRLALTADAQDYLIKNFNKYFERP